MSLPSEDVFPHKGVSIQFLKSFSSALQEDSNFTNISTSDIVELLTDSTQPTLSIVNLLCQHKRHSKRTHPIVSTPTIFLCHSWDYRFSDLIDTLCRHYPQSQWNITFVWIDVFCLSPYELVQRRDWNDSRARASIQHGLSKIPETIAISLPSGIREPKCLMEMYYTTTKSKSKLTVLFHNEKEETKMLLNWVNDYENIVTSIITDTLQSQRLTPSGRDTIRTNIVTALSNDINTLLFKYLFKCQSSLKTIYENKHKRYLRDYSLACYAYSQYWYNTNKQYDPAYTWLKTAKDAYCQLPANYQSIDTIKAMIIHDVLINKGLNKTEDDSVAVKAYKDWLTRLEKVFGEKHQYTVEVFYAIANAYETLRSTTILTDDMNDMNMKHTVIHWYMKGLRRHCEVLGATHTAIVCIKILGDKVAYLGYPVLPLQDRCYIASHHYQLYSDTMTKKMSKLSVQSVAKIQLVIHMIYMSEQITEDTMCATNMNHWETLLFDDLTRPWNNVPNINVILKNLAGLKLFHELMAHMEEYVLQQKALLINMSDSDPDIELKAMAYAMLLEKLGKFYLSYVIDDRYIYQCKSTLKDCYELRAQLYHENHRIITTTSSLVFESSLRIYKAKSRDYEVNRVLVMNKLLLTEKT